MDETHRQVCEDADKQEKQTEELVGAHPKKIKTLTGESFGRMKGQVDQLETMRKLNWLKWNINISELFP